MRTLFLIMGLVLSIAQSQAQVVVHDYAWLTFRELQRELTIISTVDVKRTIDLKPASGKDWDMDKEQVLAEIMKMEITGWELVDLEAGHNGGLVWIMRKPKE